MQEDILNYQKSAKYTKVKIDMFLCKIAKPKASINAILLK